MESKDNKLFLESINLLDREVYEFYKQNRSRVAKGINQYNLYVKAVNGLFSVLKKIIIESEGGIYVENFGYLYNYTSLRTTRKGFVRKTIKDFRRYYTFQPNFHPDDTFRKWTFDKCFEKSLLCDPVRRKAIAGKKYKIHLSLVESLKNYKKQTRAN